MTNVQNVVLVHGGFVDGSGWEGVYRLLKEDGFNVSVVQNSTLSLEDDVAVTRRVLDKQHGPDEPLRNGWCRRGPIGHPGSLGP
jgi:hypothetical protein